MLASRQPIVASLRRDAWVEVDLGAIEYNLSVVKSWLQPETKVMAIVKGDGYGHGASSVAEVLVAAGADQLGVASVDEGCQLRAAGIACPILLLSPCPSWALSTALDANLDLTITAPLQLQDVAAAAKRRQKTAKIHVKVDSGMHRLGVRPEALLSLLSQAAALKQIKLTGLFSHLAAADNAQLTAAQNAVFRSALNSARQEGHKFDLVHLASSDATRSFPETHYDLVRPGLILYGLEPKTVSGAVKPAMSVKGRVNHLQEIEPGESVGYNLTWTAARKSKIASIPIGYADGVDRKLSNALKGILLGTYVNQVGLISMDQMLFDVTDVPQVQGGDVITLVGCQNAHSSDGPGQKEHTLYLATWANQLDTITYELACRLRSRMPRIYTRHNVGSH